MACTNMNTAMLTGRYLVREIDTKERNVGLNQTNEINFKHVTKKLILTQSYRGLEKKVEKRLRCVFFNGTNVNA